MKRYLTTAQVSEKIGIPVGTLRYWRHTGYGPRSARLGRRVLYIEDECDLWVEQQFADQSQRPA